MGKLSLSGITSFSVRPLYLSLYVGAAVAASAFAYLAYAVVIKFFTEESVSGWASVIASVLLIGGIQLCLLGVVGIYLGKIFLQSKNRPNYLVREFHSAKAKVQSAKKIPSAS